MENKFDDKTLINEENFPDPTHSTETFVLEYPLNYEEIVQRKLRVFEKEYEETMKCEMKIECDDDKFENIVENLHNDDGNQLLQDDDFNLNSGYHQVVESSNYECFEDEEGFVEVQEEGTEVQSTKADNQKQSEDFISGLEFVDDKIVENKDTNIKEKFDDEIKIKDPEKIKNAMKCINMKAPKWAEKYIIIL